MAQEKKNPKKEPLPTSQVTLLVRALLGGYLLYMAYDLFFHGTGAAISVAAAVVFAVVGVLLLAFSVRRIFNGDYDLVDSKGQRIEPDDLPEEDEEAGFSSAEELRAFGEDLSFLEEDSESEAENHEASRE